MIYENGKWTIYTSQNEEFQISEDAFEEIFFQFKEHSTKGYSYWFEDVIGHDIDTTRYTNLWWTSNWGSFSEEYDERIYTESEVTEIIESTIEDIEADYFLIKREHFADKIAES
jgi:hypothetical protein